MINYIIRLILSLVNPIGKFWDNQFNRLVLKRSRTIYQAFPIINGQIVIRNKGTLRLGESVKFNCAQKSNVIGLTRTCTLAIGRNAYLEIGDYSGFSGISIYCSKKIILGKYVNAGANVSVWDTDFHPLDFEARRIHDDSKIASSPIHIEDDVFIGANSIILKGVTIGARSIIGAGSVVTRSIPPDQIWAGNPARFIKEHAYETV